MSKTYRLSDIDERAGSSSAKLKKKTPRQRRCDSCGLYWPPEEISPDYNEYDHLIGWFCGSCFK